MVGSGGGSIDKKVELGISEVHCLLRGKSCVVKMRARAFESRSLQTTEIESSGGAVSIGMAVTEASSRRNGYNYRELGFFFELRGQMGWAGHTRAIGTLVYLEVGFSFELRILHDKNQDSQVHDSSTRVSPRQSFAKLQPLHQPKET